MKPDNWNRFAAGLLAILLCLCSFSMPAFASGSDPAPEPLPEIIEEEPTTGGMEPEGVPITPKGMQHWWMIFTATSSLSL